MGLEFYILGNPGYHLLPFGKYLFALGNSGPDTVLVRNSIILNNSRSPERTVERTIFFAKISKTSIGVVRFEV